MPESILFRRKPRFGPGAPAAIHGNAIGVAHFLEIVRREGGAEPAAAVEDERSGLVRDRSLDVPLDYALAKMNGPRQAPAHPFVVFADIHQRKLLTRIEPLLHLAKVQFLDARLCIIHERQKPRRMLHGKTSGSSQNRKK